MKKHSKSLTLLSIAALFSLIAPAAAQAGTFIDSAMAAEKDEDYDRLDGRGLSGKKVNVIEWEGNLEIHVYPGGSLRGLALKLDKKNKDKPVMVIGYRFDSDPSKQLIRRAILGINFYEGFQVYRDPSSGSEYDKIVISNNSQSGLAVFKLDPEPTQLYPDGHPMLAKQEPARADAEKRRPASREDDKADDDHGRKQGKETPSVDDEGTIQPFFMRQETHQRRN